MWFNMTIKSTQPGQENDIKSSMRPRGFTFFYKIITGFGGLILLMAFSITFTLYKLSSIEDSAISVIEYQQPNAILLLNFQQDLNLAISNLNKYLLTGDEMDIAQFQLVDHRLNGYLANLTDAAAEEGSGISKQGIDTLAVLLGKFQTESKQLLYLRDNRNINYPGIRLATETLNPPALEFLGIVNGIIDEDDFDGSREDVMLARAQMNELRFVWTRMMNSFRLYFTEVGSNDLTNFYLYLDQSNLIINKLKKIDVSIGFDALENLETIIKSYREKLPPIIAMKNSKQWRQDVTNMRSIVQPLLKELRSNLNNLVYEQVKASSKSGMALTSNLEEIRIYTLALLLFSVMTGVLIALLIMRSMLPPIRELMTAAQSVADGDLNAEVVVKSSDEIGLLAVSFNAMVDGLRFAELQKEEYLGGLETINTELEERVAKRTEQLETSEARIRAVYDNIGEGIIVLDERGYIDSVNAAAKRIFKIDDKQIDGMHAIFLLADQKYSDLTKTSTYDDVKDGPFKTRDSKNATELEGKRMDGSTFPMELVVTNLGLANRNMRACIMRDITQRKEAEEQLESAQYEIVNAAHKSGMAEMATGVLHNIGNILNSVNVSVDEVSRIARNSKVSGLIKANSMLSSNLDNIGEFLTHDSKGKKLPEYYLKLGDVLSGEYKQILDESASLSEKATMMKEVIATQQAYATAGFYTEEFPIEPLIEDALKVQQSSLHKWGVNVIKDYSELPDVSAQKSKLLQVITNLIKNAKEATEANDALNKEKEIRIETGVYKGKSIYISVHDNGCGISQENLAEVFNHGFTTKETGHGFGLHSSANSMTEMGGSLNASSEGDNMGSCFTISIPIAATNKKVSSSNG